MKTCMNAATPLPDLRVNAKNVVEIALGALKAINAGTIGGPRCGKPAAFDTPLGARCEGCIEAFRETARNPDTFINVISGRARTEDEIARMIKPIAPEEP